MFFSNMLNIILHAIKYFGICLFCNLLVCTVTLTGGVLYCLYSNILSQNTKLSSRNFTTVSATIFIALHQARSYICCVIEMYLLFKGFCMLQPDLDTFVFTYFSKSFCYVNY